MTTVDFSPILNVGLQILAGLLLALGSAATAYLLRKLKLDGDAKLQATVTAAVTNAVDYGLAKATTAGDRALGSVAVSNSTLANAAVYLNEQVPDTLKKLGVGDEASVTRLVTAELGGRQPGGSAATAPVAVKDKVLEAKS